MISEIHHLPGRLRVRSRRVKDDPAFGRAVASRLRACEGVAAAQVNPLTGSVVVYYDPRILAEDRLAAALAETGLGDAAGGLAAARPAFDHLLGWAARTAVGLAVDHAIEECGLSLLAALI